MTIEEGFFKTFGIERSLDNWKKRADFLDVDKEVVASAVYPEITAEKLLELICILNEFSKDYFNILIGTTIEEIKSHILHQLINIANYLFYFRKRNEYEEFFNKVRKLFKE